MRRVARLSASALAATALAATAVAGVAGATSNANRSKPNPAVEIGTASVTKLGSVLVNGHGQVLYMFAPDGRAKVTCNAACQKIWPPDVAPRSGVAKAIGGARQSLIGSDRNPVDGRRVVTYNGWPLYKYVLDTRPRMSQGQNVALEGGFWWVLTPAGRINQTPVPHGGFQEGS
jgi:predicted lipoprotein with Yx(FWY)xxD motif